MNIRFIAKHYCESGVLFDLIDLQEPVESPTMHSGARQLCPFPVVPECHLSRLYASPRAGFRALMRLLNVLLFIHSTEPFFLQEKIQEFCLECQSSAALRCFFFAAVLPV